MPAQDSNGGRHRPASRRRARSTRRWSRSVTEKSDALDLEPGVFTGSAQEVAASLKRSALASRRRKGSPLQSAMSMLNFYINRAGRHLPQTRRRELERAKGKLREAFGKGRR